MNYHAENVLDLVHSDLCGLIMLVTPGSKKYFLLSVDDLSRYMWVTLLKSKDKVAAAIKQFQARVELEAGHKLKVLRIDRRGEFMSIEFGEYYTDRASSATSQCHTCRSRMVSSSNEIKW